MQPISKHIKTLQPFRTPRPHPPTQIILGINDKEFNNYYQNNGKELTLENYRPVQPEFNFILLSRQRNRDLYSQSPTLFYFLTRERKCISNPQIPCKIVSLSFALRNIGKKQSYFSSLVSILISFFPFIFVIICILSH